MKHFHDSLRSVEKMKLWEGSDETYAGLVTRTQSKHVIVSCMIHSKQEMVSWKVCIWDSQSPAEHYGLSLDLPVEFKRCVLLFKLSMSFIQCNILV